MCAPKTSPRSLFNPCEYPQNIQCIQETCLKVRYRIGIEKKNCFMKKIDNIVLLCAKLEYNCDMTGLFRRGMQSHAHAPTHMQKCLDV